MNQRTRTLVTAGLVVGLFAAALDQTIVDTAFPRMISDLGGGAIFTWVITAYLLASTAVVPVIGKLADQFGRKVLFLLGLVLFVGGSVLCGFAQSMPQLIAYRAFQGLGAGVVTPITFTVVGDLFAAELRAKMQGVFSGVCGLAAIVGPKLGGWLTNNLSWRWVFYVNLPVGIVAFLIILLYLQESRGEKRPVDYWGAVTVTGGISLLLLTLVQAGNAFAWLSWQTCVMTGGAALLLAVFVLIERRVPEPMLSFDLFKNQTYSVMSIVAFLTGVVMFGTIVFVPWFVQGVLGVNPDQSGNIMTPVMISMVICSILAGRLSIRLAYRWVVSAGFIVMGAGLLLTTQWSAETSRLTATWNMMIFGAGLGLVMPTLTLAVQNALHPRFRGQVTSGVTFFRSIGATVGASVFGVIFNNQMSARFTANLGPLLAQVQQQLSQAPAAVVAQFNALTAKPQGLVQVLLQQQIRSKIPPQVLGPLSAGIKTMMTGSLHTVYTTGAVTALAGVLVAQFLGRASLRSQAAALAHQGLEVAKTTAVVAD